MVFHAFASLTLVLAPSCDEPAWREAVIALDAADQALIDLWQAAEQAEQAEAADASRDQLGRLRAFTNRFVLETATLDCVRTLILDHPDAYRSYDLIVRHSYPSAYSGPELIEQALEWNETLFAEGAIHAVTYGGLIDRYELGRHDRQLYGSHLSCMDGEWRFDPPIHEPDQLEARRAAIGWPGEITDARLGQACGAAARDD
jgi:hypothetical protein